MMKFIDSHSHIYSDDFSDDLDEVMARAREVGVDKILLPNIDVDSINQLKDTYLSYPDYTYPMMGLHPTSVDGNYKQLLDIIHAELVSKEIPYIAVGEIGLDFYWDKTYVAEQIEALKEQLNWALELELPVVIHSRDAYAAISEVISLAEYKNLKGVIHSFTGSVEELNLFLPLENWFIGINGIVTFKNSNLSEVVTQIPLNRLLIETDSPYLAPVPKRGKRNESSFLIHTLLKCATCLNIPVEELAEITKRNTEYLFGLKKTNN